MTDAFTQLLARPARPLQAPTPMELTVELDELEAACVRELSSQTGLPPVDVLRLALDGLIRSVAAASVAGTPMAVFPSVGKTSESLRFQRERSASPNGEVSPQLEEQSFGLSRGWRRARSARLTECGQC